MIIGIDEVGNFDPNSDTYNYFVAVLIDQNKDKYKTKKEQYLAWENSIPKENKSKNEVKGQLLTNEQLSDFYYKVLANEPNVLYSIVRIKPSENSTKTINRLQELEVKSIGKALEHHKSYSKGNWAEWYEKTLYWYKNRKPAHILKMKSLEHIKTVARQNQTI